MRAEAASRRPLEAAGERRSGLERAEGLARHVPLAVIVYFGLQLMLQTLVSPTVWRDQAEQIILTSYVDWMVWGYGAQGPLYTWLLAGLFTLLGEGVLAVWLLKNLLLATVVLSAYATATILRDRRAGVVAALSFLFIVPYAWEAQRDLTHTVAVLAATAVGMLAAARFLRRPTRWQAGLLGVALAAGVLSKSNFLFPFAAMAIAALIDPALRSRLADRRLVWAAVPFAIALAGRLAWMAAHPDSAFGELWKFELDEGGGPLAVAGQGAVALAKALFQYVPLFLAVVGAAALLPRLLREPVVRAHDGWPAGRRWAVRTAVLALALVVVAVLGFGATDVRDRWLQPILYPAVIAVAVHVAPVLAGRGRRLFYRLAAVAALVMLLGPSLSVVAGPRLGAPIDLNHPYGSLAEQIERAGFAGGRIFADSNLVGGNLTLHLPAAHVSVVQYPHLAGPAGASDLVVWQADRGDAPTPALKALAERHAGRSLDGIEPRFVSAPLIYGTSDDPPLRLGFMLVEPEPSR